MESSESSISSDEEFLEIARHIERPRVYRERENQFEKYSESEFRNRFRLTKENVNILVELIEDNIPIISYRGNTLSIMEQILISLRFYATGSFQILIGDDCNIHKTTVCRVVKKVTREIARLCP
ncbi:hypothetical protein NQ315_007944 [Exocentrus adspersus]|uniref:Nuclease HARBI1 n=1 Tax=Exocentrus adspersus TaxID=1586481 RepID=A0AAV8VBJ0_9CUCU|nr:hypothetical protein NQ315_007944 [Exocentrus adspersus]